MVQSVNLLKEELTVELHNILSWWKRYTIDNTNGGFLGQIDFSGQPHPEADKGAVLNARMLWTFSAAYAVTKNESDKQMAERAFTTITDHFYDNENGGVYWSVTADGSPKDRKKQIYALAFAIYGLSEFYAISDNITARDMGITLYQTIEQYSYDPIQKGYFEAFTQDWEPIDDLRLSEKDANEKKTMNTHLHIVEAYVNLYKIWPNEELKNKIVELLEVIEQHFIDKKTGHLKLFFDENWIQKPDVISYGHDIEAAWLLQQCAEITNDQELIKRYRDYAILMTDATFEGIDSDGGLWYEYDPQTNRLILEKHWWPQAELLIGLFNAWELTKDSKYLDAVFKNWEFIKNNIVDQANGEWIWGVDAENSPIKKDKAGFWKCPYHNARACLELIQRINNVE